MIDSLDETRCLYGKLAFGDRLDGLLSCNLILLHLCWCRLILGLSGSLYWLGRLDDRRIGGLWS